MSENTCIHCGKLLHWVNRPDGWVLIHSDDRRSIHGCTNAPPLAPATGSPAGLIIHCEKCKTVLTKPGALIFAPPSSPWDNRVGKYHFCFNCWITIAEFIRQENPDSTTNG